MKTGLYLIYVPGLGDSRVTGQRLAVRSWKIWGVQTEVFQMNWADKEPWAQKFQRLIERIDVLRLSGTRVALVGSSAGASAVVNAYAARQQNIVGCVLIAGKVNRPQAIGRRYATHNPAFVASVQNCQQSLVELGKDYRARILSLYAVADGIVHCTDSVIEGAHNKRVWSVGHAFTIGVQIIFGAPRFIRFLKRQSV